MACIFHGMDENEISDSTFSKLLFITTAFEC